jgi:hypothetical protein
MVFEYSLSMDTQELLLHEWPYLLGCLPEQHLDESARGYGALSRRREVDSASTLLRLAMAYSCCELSLRQTAAWATAAGIADISDVALLKRLRNAGPWLGHLLAIKLADLAPPLLLEAAGHRIRLVDATAISQPGSHGTDYRLHLGYDLGRQTFDFLEFTNHKGGETLTRFAFAPGELVLADRGYSHRRGLYSVVQAGAEFLVRLSWAAIPLQTLAGEPFDLLAALRELPEAAPQSFALQVTAAPKLGLPAFPVTLVAVRRSEASADETRRRILVHQTNQRYKLQQRTLEMADYVCLLTSLGQEQLSAAKALELYRFRWQIELAFKRLKSLLALGDLPAKDPALVHTIIYAKLLAALILDDYTGRYLGFFPWGYRVARTPPVLLAD